MSNEFKKQAYLARFNTRGFMERQMPS
jgi:hypothetical protein